MSARPSPEHIPSIILPSVASMEFDTARFCINLAHEMLDAVVYTAGEGTMRVRLPYSRIATMSEVFERRVLCCR
jgi:hypothetical protein